MPGRKPHHNVRYLFQTREDDKVFLVIIFFGPIRKTSIISLNTGPDNENQGADLMGIKYFGIPCFLLFLVSYSQASAEVVNCEIVSITSCHDCAPVKVKCGKKVGYVNNIRLNHIKVKVMNLSDSAELTYQLDSPPDSILQYRVAAAAIQLNPWVRDQVSKRFEMNDVKFDERNLLISIVEDGFGLDPAITLYRSPQRDGGKTISSVPDVPFRDSCEYLNMPPKLLFSYESTNMCIGEVICHSNGNVFETTAVCHPKSNNRCPSAKACYRTQDIAITTPVDMGLIRYYDSKNGSIIDPGKNPGK